MYRIKNDQRSIRSTEMLYEGLAKLMGEKDFAAITVTDLVEAAKVGRTTFYRNFDVIEDILRMRTDQVMEGLREYLQEYRKQNANESQTKLLKPMLRYFYLHSEIIELLITANRIGIFQESFRRLMEPLKPTIGALYGVEQEYVEYILAIHTGAITSILIHWIEAGKKHAPDELADKLSPMIGSEKSPWASI
jgi:AcrR family transcriptional regulator